MAGIPASGQCPATRAKPIPATAPQTATFPASLAPPDPLTRELAALATWTFPPEWPQPAFSADTPQIPSAADADAAAAPSRLEACAAGTGITVDRRSTPLPRRIADLTDRIAANRRTAAKLEAAKIDSQARHLRECHTHLQAMVCDSCHSQWYAPCTCKLRWCAICGPRTAAKHARLALALFAAAQAPRWLTLTMARQPNLADGLDKLKRAFRNWRLNPRIRAYIRGGMYQIEIKPKPDGWHIHLHALIDGAYIPKPVLWASWAAALGQKTASVQINAIKGKQVIRYVTKYALKAQDLADMSPAQLAAYVTETRKRRLIATWGTWYNQTLAKLLQDATPPKAVCPFCHQPDHTYPIRAGPRVIGDLWPDYRNHYWPNVADIIPDPQFTDAAEPGEATASHDEVYDW